VNRRVLQLLALVAVLALLLPTAASATCVAPRTTLTAVWNDLMCPSCHEPLSVAQSPQAIAERDYVRHLIAECYTRAQVMREMVAQYTTSVLGKPPASGFNLTIYVLPPALVLLGIAVLLFTLPKWRARARAAAAASSATGDAGDGLSREDSERLDRDLAGFS
jgi:cytochrome c-type biogenesis protein CcmH